MNLRKYRSDSKDLLEQGKSIKSSYTQKYQFRMFGVNIVLSGTPVSQVGASAGYSKAAVTGWVKTVDEKGFVVLRAQQRPGLSSKLSEQQLKEIDDVMQTDPKDHDLKVWEVTSLSSYIKSHYNVDIEVRQCQRLFRNLGYSHIQPQPHPSKGCEDTEARTAL